MTYTTSCQSILTRMARQTTWYHGDNDQSILKTCKCAPNKHRTRALPITLVQSYFSCTAISPNIPANSGLVDGDVHGPVVVLVQLSYRYSVAVYPTAGRSGWFFQQARLSARTFRFINSMITDIGPLCGPLTDGPCHRCRWGTFDYTSGGTTAPVHGTAPTCSGRDVTI